MKVCNVCGKTLPVEKFSKDKKAKGGHRRYCKVCDTMYRKYSGKGLMRLAYQLEAEKQKNACAMKSLAEAYLEIVILKERLQAKREPLK